MVSCSDNYFFIDSVDKINRNDWNECTGIDHPFTRHEFLSALENSKSANSDTGWKPHHYVEINKDKKVIALCPLYIKNHSYGEYIFDHSWAEAYQRYGLNYYPKLQSAIPFTPVTGERIIISNLIKDKILKKTQILNNIIDETKKINVSSVHFNFIQEPSDIRKNNLNVLIRQGIQYHWKNNNYKSFDDFLKSLSSRKRKVIKKERLCLKNNNLKVKILTGNEIEKKHIDFFYKCYTNTTGRKWGHKYLTKEFFININKNFNEKIVLFLALNDDTMVASAINFLSSTHLYGRLWGSLYEIPYLHFELCYYQAVEYAIKNKILVVEAGAQGEHKIQRGYMPEKTWSLHWIKDQKFSFAINKYLHEEKNIMNQQKKDLEKFTPYKF
mgnify:CR=1 FL=1